MNLFSITTKELKNIVKLFKSVKLPLKSGNTPILTNTLWTIRNHGASTIFAMDFDRNLTYEIESIQFAYDLHENMTSKMLIYFPVMAQFVKSKAERIHCEYDSGHHYLTDGVLKVQIPEFDISDMPEIPDMSLDHSITVDRADFHSLLSKAQHAMSCDESRASLNGVLLELNGTDVARIVSTDTHRLFAGDLKLYRSFNLEDDVIIRYQSVIDLSKLFKPGKKTPEQYATIWFDGPYLRTQIDNITYQCRLIEGRFPTYRTVIPESFSGSLEFNTESLLSGIESLKSANSEKFKAIEFKPNCQQVQLCYSSADQVCNINIDAVINTEIESVGYNLQYLIDTLKNIDEDTVTFNLVDDVSPMLINELNCQYIIMPMRV